MQKFLHGTKLQAKDMIFIDRNRCQVGRFSLVTLFLAPAFAPRFQDRESSFGKIAHAEKRGSVK
jgi:hypothetical protein